MEEKKIRPQDKWNAKAGLISKSYKLKKEVTEQFAEACKEENISQAGQITKMMNRFINRKEIEKEYAEVHSGLEDCCVGIDVVINGLKELSRDAQSEELRARVEGCINDVFLVKDDLMKHNRKLYDSYNKIYQKIDVT